MSATDDPDMPITVGDVFQTAYPELSAVMVDKSCPKTLAAVEAFERVRSESRFGIGIGMPHCSHGVGKTDLPRGYRPPAALAEL
jgi:hypothetical protein